MPLFKRKAQFQGKLRLKKGDEVIVLAGKDKGKRGKIIQTIPDEGKVIIDGVNIVTRHQRPRMTGRATPKTQTGTIKKPAPLAGGKVMLICPHCSKPAKTTIHLVEDGGKTRVCKLCHQTVDAT
ncbi:MAG: 50S ribosomal protein L24 [Armatimonadota bacterium]|nr:50S ribosomal protein L24 [Armatimonadota bacterium]